MSATNFHVLAKPIGPICNLDCKYCFYLEKESLYPQVDKWAMQPEVLESYIRQYIEAHDTPVVNFAWQGGEPTLLGVDYFRRVVELEKYANGKRIENAFQTNGVLLNDAWAEFFLEKQFLIGISIDGPRELHDAYRVDKGGQPTFDRVMRGIETLQRNKVEFNTLTTVHRANADSPLEVYRFLKENGSGYMQFIPIVERIAHQVTADGLRLISPDFTGAAKVAPWSVEPRQFGRFLCAIFDEWVRKDVGRTFVQLFDVSLELWSGMEASLASSASNCGAALAIEHCGDLYSCDHFVYPENRLGNIMESPLAELVGSRAAAALRRGQGVHAAQILPRVRRALRLQRRVPQASLPHHSRRRAGPELPLRRLQDVLPPHRSRTCASWRRSWCAQRAPANVMRWVAAQDAQAAIRARPGRNDPCPCGSGKKFKHCCLARLG